MADTLEALEGRRRRLVEALAALGDFRRGTISVNYRTCGKPNCACAQPGHRGHGPQYLWTATIGGKSRARNLRRGAALEKVAREVANYRTFVRLCGELVEVNEEICDRRPAPAGAEAPAGAPLKKKLRRRFARRSAAK